MIRCNNCMSEYESKEELSQIVEKLELFDGEWYITDVFIYEPTMDLRETENTKYNFYRGCPYCLGHENLMDLVPYEK